MVARLVVVLVIGSFSSVVLCPSSALGATAFVDTDCSDYDSPVFVGPSDPDGLDRDGDGIGCELNAGSPLKGSEASEGEVTWGHWLVLAGLLGYALWVFSDTPTPNSPRPVSDTDDDDGPWWRVRDGWDPLLAKPVPDPASDTAESRSPVPQPVADGATADPERVVDGDPATSAELDELLRRLDPDSR